MRLRRRWLPLILPILLLPVLCGADRADLLDVDKVVKSGLKTITAGKGRAHIVYLAGPECEGRASGERGADVAAKYLEEQLKEFGLEPGGDHGGWRQNFPVNAGPFPGQRPKVQRPTGSQTTSNVVGVTSATST
jgi:hypothetical protein